MPPGRNPSKPFINTTLNGFALRRNTQTSGARKASFTLFFPLIKESEKTDLQSLETGFENLKEVFPNFKMSKVHGKMKPKEKEEEMNRFVKGETQILVATTVIEEE